MLPPHLTHVHIAFFIAWWDHPLQSVSAPQRNQLNQQNLASISLHWQQQVHADLLCNEALEILEMVCHREPTQ